MELTGGTVGGTLVVGGGTGVVVGGGTLVVGGGTGEVIGGGTLVVGGGGGEGNGRLDVTVVRRENGMVVVDLTGTLDCTVVGTFDVSGFGLVIY